MVTQIPSVTNWSVTPQNGQVGYFTLMNTWLFESTNVISSLNTAITKINEASSDINEIGTNAINAIMLDTIEDLATYTGTGLVMVKDINRGGTFTSKTVIEINPKTGSLYAVDNGTVFAKLGGGFWARDYNYYIKAEWFDAKGDGIIDDTIPIQNALNTNQTVLLSEKTYIATALTLNEGNRLIGSSMKTILKQKSDSVAANMITVNKGASASMFTLLGKNSYTSATFDVITTLATALDMSYVGTQNGIVIAGEQVELSNIRISQFSRAGLTTNLNNSGAYQPLSRMISNIVVSYNWIGIETKENSEYATFIGIIGKFNGYGIVNIGGNNSFSNSKVDHSRVGMYLKSGLNDGHGEFTGGSINHSRAYSILADNIHNGFLYSNLDIYGSGNGIVDGVYIKQSMGIKISNSKLSGVSITCDGHDTSGLPNKGQNIINDCIFNDMGSTYVVTEINDSNLLMYNNEMEGGDDSSTWVYSEYINNTKYDMELWKNKKNTNNARIVSGKDVAEYYVGGVTVTGAIKITLPPILSDTVIELDVEIMDLTLSPVNLKIQGYYSTGLVWAVANVTAKGATKQYKVSFGKVTGGALLIYLGDTTTTWRYETISIKSVLMSKSLNNIPKNVKYGWNIELDSTALQNILFTKYSHSVVNETDTATGALRPITDNNITLGSSSYRWSVVYAGTGTINTSDDRLKIYLTINEKEKLVAKELKQLIKKFKFKDSIKEKGKENARIHFGTSAQSVKDVFEKQGLNPFDYALLCYDEWEEKAEMQDEDGNIIQEFMESGNRYGIRYEELLCFIISSL